MTTIRPVSTTNISLVAQPMQADRAYTAVRDMIVSLELRPGAVIDERSLMDHLQIGRTPLREAVRRLAQERLVEVFPRRGTFVTSVEIRDLASLAEVRLVLESHAAALAADRCVSDVDAAILDLVVEHARVGDLAGERDAHAGAQRVRVDRGAASREEDRA